MYLYCALAYYLKGGIGLVTIKGSRLTRITNSVAKIMRLQNRIIDIKTVKHIINYILIRGSFFSSGTF